MAVDVTRAATGVPAFSCASPITGRAKLWVAESAPTDPGASVTEATRPRPSYAAVAMAAAAAGSAVAARFTKGLRVATRRPIWSQPRAVALLPGSFTRPICGDGSSAARYPRSVATPPGYSRRHRLPVGGAE
ncbi:unannotated protein [freshwater metagenome]|uniref:Unannotated protein n=1 Tax=freshwater metagenome TaxID=449393 RepID=A0A6J7JE03_9ZZZZ